MDKFSRSSTFLTMAKAAAKRTGYDPAKLFLATDGVHKLQYNSPEGLRKFGAVGYGDYLYYSTHEPEVAKTRRAAYRARASAALKLHGGGKFSPGALALNVLW